MAFSEVAMRLATAAICGAIIGFERQHKQKPAGLKTHMLVAIGAAAFTLAALQMDQLEGLNLDKDRVQIDPSRVIQGIAGGIGFLGAGSIMRSNGSVHGLTTAATIWVVGAVGICSAIGNFALAATTSVMVVLITSILGVFERWLFRHYGNHSKAERDGCSENQETREDDEVGDKNSSSHGAM